MPMYIFYPCLEDGSPTSFEAYELADDASAQAQAELVLEAHDSAFLVKVWRGGVALEPVRRSPRERADDDPEGPSPAE
jgi:hypothetical protein